MRKITAEAAEIVMHAKIMNRPIWAKTVAEAAVWGPSAPCGDEMAPVMAEGPYAPQCTMLSA